MLDNDHGPVDGLLHEVWQSVHTTDSGQVADYIPELTKAHPATCGLSLATLDGAVYTAGDLVPSTIQSVSKPFVYALALADSGAETVPSKIGLVFSPAGLEELRAEAPDACAQLTLAIARSLSQRLRASTSEVAALEES